MKSLLRYLLSLFFSFSIYVYVLHVNIFVFRFFSIVFFILSASYQIATLEESSKLYFLISSNVKTAFSSVGISLVSLVMVDIFPSTLQYHVLFSFVTFTAYFNVEHRISVIRQAIFSDFVLSNVIYHVVTDHVDERNVTREFQSVDFKCWSMKFNFFEPFIQFFDFFYLFFNKFFCYA